MARPSPCVRAGRPTTSEKGMAPSSQAGNFRNALADVGCIVGHPSIQPLRNPPLGDGTAGHPMVYFRGRLLQGSCSFFPWTLCPGCMAHWYRGYKQPARTTAAVGTGCACLPATRPLSPCPNPHSLWKCFGAHKGQQGLGAIAVELCCLFDLISRAPLRFVYGKACTSEHKLIPKLIQHLKKGDLLLLDTGFYYCATFIKILRRHAHFIIPAKTTLRPQVLQTLGPGDYLCQIKDSNNKTPLTVRVVFVYRNGFRRRRLVTSLLDPLLFPASELAHLYHLRWDIETFYREFKHTLRATSWHCQTPTSFHQELLMHMIALCLIRIAMLEASRSANVSVGQLSFARALTETRLFFNLLLSTAGAASVAFCLGHTRARLCTTPCAVQAGPPIPPKPAAVSKKEPGIGSAPPWT